MTTQEEINKYLTEAIDECWHEQLIENNVLKCRCGRGYATGNTEFLVSVVKSTSHVECMCANIDFFTWDGFGKLWEWSITQAWWYQFLGDWNCPDIYSENSTIKERYVDAYLINPEQFATAVYEFLKEEGK